MEHQVFQKGHQIKCSMCNTTYPNTGLISWDQETYPSLHKYFINIVQNNNTTNIVNNYNSSADDDFCEVAIDVNIFNDQKFTDIVNQILDGHKICDVARLLKTKYDLFVYDKKMKDWYFFNGFRWVPDGSLDFKEKVIEARSILLYIFLRKNQGSKNIEKTMSLLPELWREISLSLSLKDLQNLRLVSRFFYNVVTQLSGFGGFDAVNDAFRLACKKGQLEAVKLLLGDPRVNPSDNDNCAVCVASENGHDSVVKLLLADSRVDPSAENNYATAVASWSGHLSIVKLLLADSRVDPSDGGNCAVRFGLMKRDIMKL